MNTENEAERESLIWVSKAITDYFVANMRWRLNFDAVSKYLYGL